MYIEVVIADNFLLTYIAGAAALRSCRVPPRAGRLALGGAIGAAVAVCYPFVMFSDALRIAVKLALWVALSFVLFRGERHAAAGGLLFLGYTLAFGGANYALGFLIFSDFAMAQSFCSRFPLFVTLGVGALTYGCARYCMHRLRIPRAAAPYTFRTEVEAYGQTLGFCAFLDTGNTVFDEHSGMPVIITDAAAFVSKLSGAGASRFALDMGGLRRISAFTAAGEAQITLLRPQRVTVYSDKRAHKINAVVGILAGGEKVFSGEYEMLLNPAAMTEGV